MQIAASADEQTVPANASDRQPADLPAHDDQAHGVVGKNGPNPSQAKLRPKAQGQQEGYPPAQGKHASAPGRWR
ncbi:hypothetical protein WN72_13285 [Bradyrhizobium arachidis]|uniref:Uncharacterized protein n=1 Tax=Bradyrhizobium arachidis TaxID=858423 RepID=A0AAE7TF80_9BRAD|nr:hypothetical protein WN72_05790 [Bradyrhizobium arachidis]QOZ67178.1 hypothetical protein WN72_13285 [Bradyrhizobium arachidis]